MIRPVRVLAWIILATVVATAGIRGQGAVDERAARIEALVDELHARGWFAGGLIVAEEGRVLVRRGYGWANRAARVPFTTATATEIGSMTKTFTAAAVLRLVEAGRLRLEDPVARHVAGFPYPEVTVSHLLEHSSGLPEYDYFEARFAKGTVWTNERFLETLAAEKPPLGFRPGTAFSYSNVGYDFAALVVERVSGLSFGEFLRRELLERAGVRHAFIRPARFADWVGERTRGYRLRAGRWEDFDAFDDEGMYGADNLFASAEDLHAWNECFWKAPPLGARALADWLRPALIGGRPSGLGLLSWYASADGNRFSYAGEHRGFRTRVYRDLPRRRSVVFATNHGMPQWLMPALVRAIGRLLDGAEVPVPEAPRARPIAPDAWGESTGGYLVDEIGRVDLKMEGERVTCRPAGGLDYRAYPVSRGMLYVPGVDVWLWFDADSGRLAWSTVLGLHEGSRAAGGAP